MWCFIGFVGFSEREEAIQRGLVAVTDSVRCCEHCYQDLIAGVVILMLLQCLLQLETGIGVSTNALLDNLRCDCFA